MGTRENSLYLGDGDQGEQPIFGWWVPGRTAHIWVMGTRENSLYLGDWDQKDHPIFGRSVRKFQPIFERWVFWIYEWSLKWINKWSQMNLAIKFGENNEFQSPKSWKSDRIVRRCYLPLVIFLKKITQSYKMNYVLSFIFKLFTQRWSDNHKGGLCHN